MRRFHTGMLAHGYPIPKGFPYRGKGWTLRVVDYDPGGLYKAMRAVASRKILKETRCPKEVVIDAETEHAACRANDLLWNALSLIHAGQYWMDSTDVDRTIHDDKEIVKNPILFDRSILRTSGVPKACEVASKASFRRSTIYALAKYHVGSSFCSVPLVDLDPTYATATFPKLKRPIQSVQAATALVLAYGVIEELGLEVRANPQKPSRLPDGSWNPVVKEELEARLMKAGVNLAEQINWQIRGQRTKLELEKPRQIYHTAKPSPWARWTIRDRMVDVVDAIAHLSWLRSSVSSHRLKASMVGLLTVYDITNGQFLARRLILECLGLWQNWAEGTK